MGRIHFYLVCWLTVTPTFSLANDKSQLPMALATPYRRDPVKPESLYGNSSFCQQFKGQNPEIEKCNLNQPTGLSQVAQQIQDAKAPALEVVGKDLSGQIKQELFEKARSSFQSQFAATTWLAGENPLKGSNSADRERLNERLEKAKALCHESDSAKGFEQLSKQIASMSGAKDYQTLSPGQPTDDASRDFILKRILIAALELNRIDRFVNDYALPEDEKIKLRALAVRIRETYPMVTNSELLLKQQLKVDYNVSQRDSKNSHPFLDLILFADTSGKFTERSAVSGQRSAEEWARGISKPNSFKTAYRIYEGRTQKTDESGFG